MGYDRYDCTGSSGSCTGNAATATTARKLSISAGNSGVPVYFSNGVPIPCSSISISTGGFPSTFKNIYQVSSDQSNWIAISEGWYAVRLSGRHSANACAVLVWSPTASGDAWSRNAWMTTQSGYVGGGSFWCPAGYVRLHKTSNANDITGYGLYRLY